MNLFLTLLTLSVLSSWFFLIGRILIQSQTFPPLQTPETPLAKWPFVSILVAARNEEKNIGNCLEHLLKLDYPNYEVIAVDDRSDDRTLEIMKAFETSNPRLKILHIETSAEGWSGKNYALYRGVALARGDWYLFTDADTQHYSDSLKIGLSHALNHRLGALTLLSQLECKGLAEKLIQPIASGLMLLWYPPKRVNNPEDPLGFGNGQYLLIGKESYELLGTHAAVKDKLLEDVALAEKAKELHIPFQMAIGTFALKTRMYRGFKQSWNGWKRIFLHLAERDLKQISIFTIGFFFLGILPFLLFLITLFGNFETSLKTLTAFTLLVSIGTRWHLNYLSRQPLWPALFYPLGSILVLGMLLEATWESLTDKKTLWRGRHY